MMKLRAKTIVRRLSAFALCASLSLSLVSAHAADAAHPTTAEETAVAADAVMASLPYGFLSASCETVVDSVGTTEDIQAAKDQLAEEARAAEEAAKAAAEAEAKAAAAAARLTTLRTAAVTPRAISKSSALKADSVIRENTKKLGSFRLSFYCPCATCNGRSDAKTKIGTRMAEGRTIAVDSRIIPHRRGHRRRDQGQPHRRMRFQPQPCLPVRHRPRGRLPDRLIGSSPAVNQSQNLLPESRRARLSFLCAVRPRLLLAGRGGF